MKYAFVNPKWSFTGSTYFGCRDPHYPLELLFAAQKVENAGHAPLLVDAQNDDLALEEVKRRVAEFEPDFLVIPSAPSYLFWRCPPPELRVPMDYFRAIETSATKVCIGPHASATPAAVLRKTGADIVIKGEPEQAIFELATKPWEQIDGVCYRRGDGSLHISPTLAVVDMKTLTALDFSNYSIERHAHRHHVFFGEGRGAELEFARGCPWNCYFCNKQLFRNKFRERPVDAILSEIDAVIARGVNYVYFIDEIFGVGKNVRMLLEEISKRNVSIGFQTRIDLWDEDSLDLLGRAHCISMECGIESITEEGREELNKNCRMTTERITELLIYAKEKAGIPWVQANLILTDKDDKNEIHRWQDNLKSHGVWVSEPVPMFPFPGSPLYSQTFGAAPDDNAWERAHSHYMSQFREGDWSDIQEQLPRSIAELESVEENAAR
ncbi:Fe-S protein, radical SAM family [Candidatus Koribacter versatilis Ellin345]|uniref:Fe-S protein, radical SAM family n=1 Tax=Koribacter versatilis (strain Ellin345) TaxID=204669 RepID=Q1IKV3_KORVE|nr:TIGR04295 family B12-binding domain-containing radical SAM protein [Candidatus Koribacter versatilis]ABF42497.1 Fe-S protein, radical SAM family [Candidatus Koribacter versatilis Ellin345]